MTPVPVPEVELVATVYRMEARLAASAEPGVATLLALYYGLIPRFATELGASSRDVALANASALMNVQAAAHGKNAI
jgi:hypothetical protein